MPAPGDEWAAGDVPDEPEYTSEALRHLALWIGTVPRKRVYSLIKPYADVWEKREAQSLAAYNAVWGENRALKAHIEALEGGLREIVLLTQALGRKSRIYEIAAAALTGPPTPPGAAGPGVGG